MGVKPVKAVAAILFSMGSVFLVAELTIRLVIEEEELAVGTLAPSGWTAIGILGLVGWITGAALLLYLRLFRPLPKDSGSNIFLAGRRSFTCRTCGREIGASKVGYHERIECRCGSIYNIFQEMEGDIDR